MTEGKNKLTLAVFSITLFVSAALMFGLQPMIGKMLLPLVGGTPAGWIVAMAFFQLMLLGGYFLAHLLSRFTPRVHALLFSATLAVGAIVLPVYLPVSLEGIDTPGPVDIFKLLFMTVGLPFLALSTTSSTIQRLFTTTSHKDSADPYFLYGASNLGSFAGLLLYPIVIEPLLPLSAQSQQWMLGYVGLIVLTLLCLAAAGKKQPEAPAAENTDTKPVDLKLKLQWVLLAFIPSALMLAVTTHLTTDIFSAPMMWVLPLAIYLLTFVIAFARKPPLNVKNVTQFHPILVAVTLGIMFLCRTSPVAVSWYAVFLHLAAFGATALACHMHLVQLRPVATPRHLTTFYLMLAIGGALGGILNAFIIPFTLDRLIEYPVLLILSLLVNPRFFEKRTGIPLKIIIGLAVFMIILIGFIGMLPLSMTQRIDTTITVITAVVVCGIVFLSLNIRAAFICSIVMFLATQVLVPHTTIYEDRNFYGYIRVTDIDVKINGVKAVERIVRHGSTKHGSQIMNENFETTATTYYTRNSPPAEIIRTYNPKDIAIIGLGAGTLNCYSTPENAFTFIDIDAHMVEVAQKHFTYLEKCQARQPPRLLIGDGRLELARLKDEKFDLILLDAFSSDAIPVHLLTTDAIEVYLSRLNEGGTIAFHVSNRYFNLVPVLAKNADALNLQVYSKLRIPPARALEMPSLWVVMSRKDVNISPLMEMSWTAVPPLKRVKPWTDDDNNLMSALIMLNNRKKDYAEAPRH